MNLLNIAKQSPLSALKYMEELDIEDMPWEDCHTHTSSFIVFLGGHGVTLDYDSSTHTVITSFQGPLSTKQSIGYGADMYTNRKSAILKGFELLEHKLSGQMSQIVSNAVPEAQDEAEFGTAISIYIEAVTYDFQDASTASRFMKEYDEFLNKALG